MKLTVDTDQLASFLAFLLKIHKHANGKTIDPLYLANYISNLRGAKRFDRKAFIERAKIIDHID